MKWSDKHYICYFTVSILQLLILYTTDFTECKVHYYIVPYYASNPCPQHPCLTLSQFAANFTGYIGDDVNVSLSILSGNHTLDTELNLAHLDTVSVCVAAESDKNNLMVIVVCTYRSGRFVISDTAYVSIQGIHFIGCSGNKVSHVGKLIFRDAIFQGIKDNVTGRVLELNMVADATMVHSSFFFNSNAVNGDAVIFSNGSSFTIASSILSDNDGNFMHLSGPLFCMTNSTIINNREIRNSDIILVDNNIIVVTGENCSVNITDSIFNNNVGSLLLLWFQSGSLSIINGTFTNNNGTILDSTRYGSDLVVNITGSDFVSNRIRFDGLFFDLACLTFGCNTSLFITSTNFIFNNAPTIISVCGVDGILFSNVFIRNCCTVIYGIPDCSNTCKNDVEPAAAAIFHISSSVFKGNHDNNPFLPFSCIDSNSQTIQMSGNSLQVINTSFNQNSGPFYIIECNIILKNTRLVESQLDFEGKIYMQKKGAIMSYQSNIIFMGKKSLLHNAVGQGGAIFASESTIMIHGEVIIANNTAKNSSGGGIYLQHSKLEIRGKCVISNNHAMLSGGGIFASSSSIIIDQFKYGALQIINNSAKFEGGGVYLEINPTLTLVKAYIDAIADQLTFFIDNHASYGGAIYVADDTSSIPCSPKQECFIQLIFAYKPLSLGITNSMVNIYFSSNVAGAFGSNLFGGLLDRCIPSSHAAAVYDRPEDVDGFTYISAITNITRDSVASSPVKICFCNSDNQPDCNHKLPLFT